MGFGLRLTEFRERAGLSGAELAARAGVSRMHVHRIERGERDPSWEIACRIADALGVRIEKFREIRRKEKAK